MRFGEKRASVSAQREVRITNELGLHARPAAEFVKRANSFRSEIWVVKGGKRYSAASLIDILRANLDCGATATLEAHGVDAEEALERLEKLLAEFHEREKRYRYFESSVSTMTRPEFPGDEACMKCRTPSLVRSARPTCAVE